MKDKLYKDWQSGMNYKELGQKYFITAPDIKKLISQTPQERTCRSCGIVFKVTHGQIFCSRRCCRVHHDDRLKGKAEPKKRKRKITLTDYLDTINVADYGKLQKAETFNMIGGAK